MTREKPVILAFNKFYLPGYRAGGPIRTLANMVERLGNDFDFFIITLDRDAGDKKCYESVPSEQWITVSNAQVMYLPPDKVSIDRLQKIVAELSPDTLYLNSFFDPVFSQRILWGRRLGRLGKIPIILAPRGEFSPGALQLKPVKKKLYLHAARLLGLYGGLVWQASSEHERENISLCLHFVPDDIICVAMNLAPPALAGLDISSKPKQGESLRICFLSRISPKKNLDYALRVLHDVKARVHFTIYGPKEVLEYWEKCESLIATLPSNISVSWEGEVHPSEVRGQLRGHDLFLFPTRGENYGHVIHEALGAGLPVLLSDQTPWGKVTNRGVGWVFSLVDNELRFAEVIDQVSKWDDTRFQEVRQRALIFAQELAESPETLAANKALFARAIEGEYA